MGGARVVVVGDVVVVGGAGADVVVVDVVVAAGVVLDVLGAPDVLGGEPPGDLVEVTTGAVVVVENGTIEPLRMRPEKLETLWNDSIGIPLVAWSM